MTAPPDGFDRMARDFTVAMQKAAAWKDIYFGAAYSTRIRTAIAELKVAIACAEAHPEIGDRSASPQSQERP
jgi:hypothetical protein